ncbi:MAG: hypothetical protein HON90_15760 [Halobacteriovoraceae bacterium]|jgi:hypothetical protein|nr:hypothetical protein [Halobacteriovoraceae bacterium]
MDYWNKGNIFLQNLKDNKDFRLLLLIFGFAVTVRMMMPLYIINSDRTDTLSLMSYSSHGQIFTYIQAFVLENTQQYFQNLDIVTEYYLPYSMLLSIPLYIFKLTDSPNTIMISIMSFQALIDSFGCFIIFCIVNRTKKKHLALGAAGLYAIWLPSIFYSYHIMCEALIPVLTLVNGLLFIRFYENRTIYNVLLLGIGSGAVFTIRPDNILLAFFVGIYLLLMNEFFKKKVLFILLFCIGGIGFNQLTIQGLRSSLNYSEADSTLAIGLYNALGENPGTYKGIRFYSDEDAYKYSIKKAIDYRDERNVKFEFINSILSNSPLSAYITEVIVEKPVLYIDWLTQRFVHYFSAHNYVGFITYFISSFPQPQSFVSVYGYRFSSIYNFFKIIDYILFVLFLSGVFSLWHEKKMRILMWMYIGVLVSHIPTQVGEVFFHNDKEHIFNNPAFLLGMVTLWPIFIPFGLSKLKNMILFMFLGRSYE